MNESTSSHALVPFTYDGRQVRTVVVDGEVWFVAADVCNVLGYRNGRDAVAKHVREAQRRASRIATPSGEQSMTVISEPGLYRLIMRSSATDAERFQDWVTEDVLPQIRRTGGYASQPQFEIPANYAEALELAARKVREVEALERRNAELRPAADAWDVLASAEGDYSVGDAAKMLSRDPSIVIGQNRLFQFMYDIGWIFRRGESWRAYQTQVNHGRLAERANDPYRHPHTGELVLPAPQVRVTAKGLMALRRELTGMSQLPIPG